MYGAEVDGCGAQVDLTQDNSGSSSGKYSLKTKTRKHSKLLPWIVLAVFALLYAMTVQETPGDTVVYQGEILQYARSGGSKPMLLWEFWTFILAPAGLRGMASGATNR